VYRWDPATGQMFVNGIGQGVPGTSRIFMTVWDGGGTDTYDLSNYAVASATIDLAPEAWSLFSVGQSAYLGSGQHAPGNVANASQYNGDPRSLIENAIGTSGNDTIRGNAAANVLIGGLGLDSLYGLGGNDTLYGDDSGDHLYGDDGNDTLYFGSKLGSGSIADGGAGKDVVVLQGNYSLALANVLAGIEYLSLQSGSVTRWGDTAGNLYSYAITMNEANAAAGQQLVVNAQSLLAGENFTFNGSAETDGRYLVYGGRGVDTFTGGAGHDVFYFEGARWGASDTIDGGAGRDAVVISLGHGLNHVEFGETQLIGIEAISVNNRFASDPSQLPSYELVLRNGNVVAGEVLIVNGSSLPAGQTISVDGNLVTGGRLELYGGAGNDALIGGAQADTIYAAGGSDTLRGGAGADLFQLYAAADSALASADRILDFLPGTDTLDLHFIDAVAGTPADDAFSFIGSAAFHGIAGELRAAFDGALWHVEGDIDGVGGADFAILLDGSAGTPITASAFVF
jgi:serralysin